MNEYADNIRRIVGLKKTKGGIDPQKELQPIGPGRGVAYFNADGSIGSKTGTAPGAGTPTVQPDDAFGGDQSEQTTGTNGGTSYGAGPGGGNGTLPDGTASNFANDGVVPATSLFDGSMGIGDSFTGVSGLYDCSPGGGEFQLNYDAYPTPTGWDSPDSPPSFDDGSFTSGKFWSSFGAFAGDIPSPTYTESVDAYVDPHPIYTDWVLITPPYYNPGTTSGRAFTHRAVVGLKTSPTDPTPTNWTWYQFTCDVSDDPNITTCATGLPTQDSEWPSDNVTQLLYNPETSQWETSPYESDAPLSYQSPVSTLKLCDANGDHIESLQGKDGTIVHRHVEKGIITVEKNGKIIAATTYSNIDTYLAK